MSQRKKQIQAYLSVASMGAVDSLRKKFKAVELSESAAANVLIERSISLQAENKRLKGEILDLQSEIATQLRMNSIMKSGEK